MRRRARAGRPRRARSRARFPRRRSASRARGSGRGASGPRAPSQARGRPRAAPTATAAGTTSARGHGRVRSVARASAAHAAATIIPSTGAEGASRPVSSSTLGSHIAASRTTRPGNRASRRARPARPAIATAPINPSQITAHRRGPRSVSRFRSSERSAGLALPRASIGCPVMSSGTATSRRSSTVGATSVELTSPSVRVESEYSVVPPPEPGRTGRHEPPGDVARVLDHQHQVGGTARREELAELPVTGRSGRQLDHQHIGISPQRACGACDGRGAHERDAFDTTRPVGRDGRLPVTRCPAGPRSRRARRRRGRWTQAGLGPRRLERCRRGRRSPAMRTCWPPRRKSQIGRHLVVVERRRRARPGTHVHKGLLGVYEPWMGT